MAWPNLPKPAYDRLADNTGQPRQPYQEVVGDPDKARARSSDSKRICDAYDAAARSGLMGYWRYYYVFMVLADSLEELKATWEMAYWAADCNNPNFQKLEILKDILKASWTVAGPSQPMSAEGPPI
jgi:hypothetical protein